jgi:hypothetical protein
MTKLMQPRQTLLDCARNEARFLPNKLKYDFLDQLEGGSLQIAASKKKNRPADGGLNALRMASWNTRKSQTTTIANSSPMSAAGTARDRDERLPQSPARTIGLDWQLRTRMV